MACIQSRHSDQYLCLTDAKMQKQFPQKQMKSSRKSIFNPPSCFASPMCNLKNILTKDSRYQDHFHDPVQQDIASKKSGFVDQIELVQNKANRSTGCRRIANPFPQRLYEVLSRANKEGYADAISWQAHGRSFTIHKPKKFVKVVASKYFRQSKIASFQRQLNIYGFIRLTRGSDRGGYYHELFLRGRPDLCKQINREPIKGENFQLKQFLKEPNFYIMEKCVENSLTESNVKAKKPCIGQVEEISSAENIAFELNCRKEQLSQDHASRLVNPFSSDSILRYSGSTNYEDLFPLTPMKDAMETQSKHNDAFLMDTLNASETTPKNFQSVKLNCKSNKNELFSSGNLKNCRIPKTASMLSLQSISSISSSSSTIFSIDGIFELD